MSLNASYSTMIRIQAKKKKACMLSTKSLIIFRVQEKNGPEDIRGSDDSKTVI